MEHIIFKLGMLLFAAGLFAVIFRIIKQSTIIAFIGVGILAGLLGESYHLPHELVEVFTELGIILLLFMAGLEVDFDKFKKNWQMVLTNGFGQIIFNTLIGIAFGLLILDIKQPATLIYFALCLTFSSTIIVIGYLKKKKEMESEHGQLILGLMVMQDIVAVVALAVLSSLSGSGSIAVSIGIIFVKMILLVLFLAVLAKFVLKHVFRYLSRSNELLFIGTLGFVMGMAALCETFHFSPEIGAFMTGAALSFLPYKLEVESKIGPLKDFGIVLFFIALGFKLNITPDIVSHVWLIVLIGLLILLGTPLLMLCIGFFIEIKSRSAFMIGGIINQISEFSLILATLCLRANIFSEELFMIVTLSAVFTFFVSCFGHEFLSKLYTFKFFHGLLAFIDKHGKVRIPPRIDRENHVIVIKYNELAERILAHFEHTGEEVILIDMGEPDLFKEEFKTHHPNAVPIYADVFDPDIRDHVGMNKARLIVSCLVEGQTAELGILNWLNEKKANVTFIATTDSRSEAEELYEAGAAFVIQIEDLAAEQIGVLFGKYQDDYSHFTEHGETHQKLLAEMREKNFYKFF